MPHVILKTGEKLEIPIDELIDFFNQHGDEIQDQLEERREHDTPPDPSAFPFTETAVLSQ
jgi:hypothetical protein